MILGISPVFVAARNDSFVGYGIDVVSGGVGVAKMSTACVWGAAIRKIESIAPNTKPLLFAIVAAADGNLLVFIMLIYSQDSR